MREISPIKVNFFKAIKKGFQIWNPFSDLYEYGIIFLLVLEEFPSFQVRTLYQR